MQNELKQGETGNFQENAQRLKSTNCNKVRSKVPIGWIFKVKKNVSFKKNMFILVFDVISNYQKNNISNYNFSEF